MSTLSVSRLRDLLNYDPDTGSLVWRVTYSSARAGVEAGWLTDKGYRLVKIDGRPYPAHRLAWLHYYGRWPSSDSDIDHRDGNRLNNSLSNLREASRSQNCANKGAQRNSSSGTKGVIWREDRRKWRAIIRVDGEQRHLGHYDSIEAAAAAYAAAAVKFYGEFARLS